MLKSNQKILFILTGSIALFKIAFVLSSLKKQGYDIKIIATKAALNFIGLSTLEGLTSEKIYTDMYESGSNMDHIHLVRWADTIVVAPATANYINKISLGIGDDLATTALLAHDFEKPVLLFPAMNTKMYNHPATTEHIQKLKNWGVQIYDSATGVLACGETGVGRLLEPDDIIKIVQEQCHLNLTSKKSVQSSLKSKKILITSGGTQEPIDNARYITNLSTGTTAAFITDQFIENGFEVTYLCAESAKRPLLCNNNCNIKTFKTFTDLKNLIEQELVHEYHTLIHAAAVSDYSPIQNYSGKINSDAEEIQLTLKRNPKIINSIKKLQPKINLIGFKLTSTQSEDAIKLKIDRLFNEAHCDIVIHNDFSTIQSGQHVFNLYKKNVPIKSNLTLFDLSTELILSVLKETS